MSASNSTFGQISCALFFGWFFAYDANFNPKTILRCYGPSSLIGSIVHSAISLLSEPALAIVPFLVVVWTFVWLYLVLSPWLFATQARATLTMLAMWQSAKRGAIVAQSLSAWACDSSVGISEYLCSLLQRTARTVIVYLNRPTKPTSKEIAISDKPITDVVVHQLSPQYDEAVKQRERAYNWEHRHRAIAMKHYQLVKQQEWEETLRKSLEPSPPAPIKKRYQPAHVHPEDSKFFTERLHKIREQHCINAHPNRELAARMLAQGVPMQFYDVYERREARIAEQQAFAAAQAQAQAAVVKCALVPEAPLALQEQEEEEYVPPPAMTEISVPEIKICSPTPSPHCTPVKVKVTSKKAFRQTKMAPLQKTKEPASTKTPSLQKMWDRNLLAFRNSTNDVWMDITSESGEDELPAPASPPVLAPVVSPVLAAAPSPLLASTPPSLPAPVAVSSKKARGLEKMQGQDLSAFFNDPTGSCQGLFGKPEKIAALPVANSSYVLDLASSSVSAPTSSPDIVSLLQTPANKKMSARAALFEKTLARNPAAFNQLLSGATLSQEEPSKPIFEASIPLPASPPPIIIASEQAAPLLPASTPPSTIKEAMAKKQDGDELKRALQQQRKAKKGKK